MTTLKPNFGSYPDKPTVLISGSYTTVRGAELREIDNLLDQQGGDVAVSAIEDRFARLESGVRNTDHVEDCLDFLQTVDFVEISGQGVVSRFNGDAFPGLSFEARLLAHLRQQCGRPRHITYISEVLSKVDERRVSTERLLEEVQSDEADSYSDELSWTKEKIQFWANLHDPLGAVTYTASRRTSTAEIISSPTRALLAELIGHYTENAEEGASALSCFEWIDDWIFPIFSERAGSNRIATGVADTLRSMEDEDVIEMYRESDTQSSVELPQKGGADRSVSAVHLNETPETTPYSYPLNRKTRRVTQ